MVRKSMIKNIMVRKNKYFIKFFNILLLILLTLLTINVNKFMLPVRQHFHQVDHIWHILDQPIDVQYDLP
jgi:hypothetical protein